MPIVRFFGRVLPLHRKVNLAGHPGVVWDAVELGLVVAFRIQIVESLVIVECEMERFEKDKHFLDLYLRAYDFVLAALDLISFSAGIGHSLILEKLIEPDGTTTDLESIFPAAAALSTATNSDPNGIAVLLPIVSTEPPVFRALRDLIDGITTGHSSAVNCGRVLDALRKLIAPELETAPGWAKLRSTLRAERSYLDLISNTSKNPRHGDFTRIKGDITLEVGVRTWTLMNRYLEFRKRGNQPLPDSEFSVLV